MDETLRMMVPLLEGCRITVALFAVTLCLSIPFGLLLALARISDIKPLNMAVEFYNWIMRGTPLMLQLLFVYFALPAFGIRLPDVTSALLAFVLNYAAYFAEIYRSGIQSIPVGQREAAKVLGYSRVQTFWKIIFPQMVKRVLPPVTNEVITLVKDTSLAFVLAYAEMFTIAKQIAAAQTTIVPLFVAGLFYYIFNLIVAVGMEYLEKRLSYYQ